MPLNPPARETPVTFAIGALWVLVFLAMGVVQGSAGLGGLLVGSISTETTHLFGDLTSREIYAGQLWRTVTATFIHFNLLHLALNLLGLIQLGRMIESWYGSAQFSLIYLVTGAFSNLLAGLIRPWIDSSAVATTLHSAGGSSVVLALIGLVAVVGWRSHNEFQGNIRFWMIAILLLNLALGKILPSIDNLVHIAGVVVGAALGLLDGWFLKNRDRGRLRWVGGVSWLLLMACVVFQFREARGDLRAYARLETSFRRLQTLGQLQVLYAQAAPRVDAAPGRLNAEARTQLTLDQLHGTPVDSRLVIAPRPPNLLRLPLLFVRLNPNGGTAEARAVLAQAIRGLRGGKARAEDARLEEALRVASLAMTRHVPTSQLGRFDQALFPLLEKAVADQQAAQAAVVARRNPPVLFARSRFERPQAAAGPVVPVPRAAPRPASPPKKADTPKP